MFFVSKMQHFSSQESSQSKTKLIQENILYLVYTALLTGHGFADYLSIVKHLRLKPIGKIVMSSINIIGIKIIDKNASNLKAARTCIFQKYGEQWILFDDQGVLEINIPFFGTWIKKPNKEKHRRHHHFWRKKILGSKNKLSDTEKNISWLSIFYPIAL